MKYSDYLKTEHWQELRLQVIRIYRTCVLCNSDKRNDLRVHHRHYDTLGEEDIHRDLTLLCENCHNRYEQNKKKRKSWTAEDRAKWEKAMQADRRFTNKQKRNRAKKRKLALQKPKYSMRHDGGLGLRVIKNY